MLIDIQEKAEAKILPPPTGSPWRHLVDSGRAYRRRYRGLNTENRQSERSKPDDWTPLMINGTPLALNASNNARAIVSTGPVLGDKPASTGYGVENVYCLPNRLPP